MITQFIRARPALVASTVLGVLAVLVGVALAAGLRTAAEERSEAQRSAERYTEPPLAESPDRVVIITEAVPTSTTQPPAWIGQIADRLDVRIDIVTLSRSAYLPRRAADGTVLTFAQSAAMIAGDAKVVLFFGGGDDTGAPAARVRAGALAALAAAAKSAPSARLVIVGPTWPSAEPPLDVQALGATLRRAATSADARYVSANSWFPGGQGLLTTGGSLTSKGETGLADRMIGVLKRELE